MENRPPEWGVEIDPSIAWGNDLQCTRCPQELVYWGKMLVGFSHVVLKSIGDQSRYRDVVGTLIIQCPNCTKRYWLHCYESTINSIRVANEAYPNWPVDENGEPL